MAAIYIAQTQITDPVPFEKYRKEAAVTIAKYGGEYLVRGGAVEIMEGTWDPKRLVVVKFDSMERAKEWYNSPDYSKVRLLRRNAVHYNSVVAEGYQP